MCRRASCPSPHWARQGQRPSASLTHLLIPLRRPPVIRFRSARSRSRSGLKTLAGVNRFEIRLDPAELGRIDVQLDISEDGEVKAHLVVDRVETLSLLQRDARTLERAFEQAGLKPSEGGVDLSLRDPAGDARHGQRGHDERNPMARGTTQREAAALRTEAVADGAATDGPAHHRRRSADLGEETVMASGIGNTSAPNNTGASARLRPQGDRARTSMRSCFF